MEESQIQLKDIDLDDSTSKNQVSFSNSENHLGHNPDVSLAEFIPEEFSKHEIMKKFYDDHEPAHKKQLRKSVCCSIILTIIYAFISIILAAVAMHNPRRGERSLHAIYFIYAFFSLLQELMLAFSYMTFYEKIDRDFLVARNQVSAEQRGDGLMPVEAFGLEASTLTLLNRICWGQLERLTVYLNFCLVFRSFSTTDDVGLQAACMVFFINTLIALSCFFPIYGARLKPVSYPDKLTVFCACTMQYGLGYISKLVAVKSRRMYAKADITEVQLKHETRPVFAGLYWALVFGAFFCLQIYYMAAHYVRLACISSLFSAAIVLVQRLRVSC
mmetsp:Transcript_6979/g.12786  ORF Transcript_6979/g.12786 Transcript_6979/m.12786 type:complete len:330 (-) Transcript_6979:378-1367(-)